MPYRFLSIKYSIFLFILIATGIGDVTQSAQEDVNKVRNFLGMEFVEIKAGSFIMGSPESESGRDLDELQHKVTLSQDFYIQTTEVTRQQWKDIMVGDPSAFPECGDDCPVSRVKWEWIQLFLQKLNTQDPNHTYRLPTEAEWEYVARAGTSSPFYTGNCLAQSHANIRADQPYSICKTGQRSSSPKPVASYPANAWGVYDMHGNAWEICSDWYGDYSAEAVIDPTGPENGQYRVMRGGSWFYTSDYARSANRFKNIRDIGGFRVVAIPSEQ